MNIFIRSWVLLVRTAHNPAQSGSPFRDPAQTRCVTRQQHYRESGARAGYDGAKRRKGNKVHLTVDTLGHLLALCVTAANKQDRAQVADLAKRVQAETGETVEIAFVDLPSAKRGFVLLPRRWAVELCFGWVSRFRRLARDYERLPQTLAGLHYLVFAILMLKNVAAILA